MLQAPCFAQPQQPLLYGHSHFKKFWLRQTESEDDPASAAAAAAQPQQQHVASSSCSPKFTTLSAASGAPLTSTMLSDQSSGPCSNVSLAASAKSFGAACASSVHGISGSIRTTELDAYQLEESLAGSAVDCTLSLGKRKRDEAITPSGLSRSGSPSLDICKSTTLFQPKAKWQPVILETHASFRSNCANESIREIFPQSSVSGRHAVLQNLPQSSIFRNRLAEYAACNIPGGSIQEMSSLQHRAYAAEIPGVEAPEATEGRRKESPTSVLPMLGIPTVAISDVVSVDCKYGDELPVVISARVASSASGHSSVDGEESILAHRTTDPELDGNVTINTRGVVRTCGHCGTIKTPLWRNGPQGPKSLCNACGIRFKKEGKRNVSTGNSSELLGSVPSPVSVKHGPTKPSKRKTELPGVSRRPWAQDAGTKGGSSGWKRNRFLGVRGRGYMESSESEGDDAVRSSGTSCVTSQPSATSPACIIPKLSVPSVEASLNPSASGFLPMSEFISVDDSSSKAAGRRKTSFAQDEEEGAKLLMALSCGLVNA